MKLAANKSILRILIILYDTCTLYLCHILQILRYSMMVAFSQSLQILNYLPIIAPDYHPFVNIKGMYCLLIFSYQIHITLKLFSYQIQSMKSSSILRNVDREVTINGTITRI